jgi:hypothetical protein
LLHKSLLSSSKNRFDKFKELLRINVIVELKFLVVLKDLTVNLGRSYLLNTCLVVD